MNIGLDIDNVITAFDKDVLKAFLKEDKNKRNTGIVNNDGRHMNDGMFDWSKEEIAEFYNNYSEVLAKNYKPRRNCKKIMDKLLEEGHKLFLISHRAYPHYLYPEKTTLDWLNKNKINYTKLILSKTPDKTEECKKYNIDIMFDDRVDQCIKMRENGINAILMFTKYNRKGVKDLPCATSWEDIYKQIKNLSQKN